MNTSTSHRAGLRLALGLAMGTAALSTSGCHLRLHAPQWDTAPRADGSLADWEQLPRQAAAGERVQLAVVQDDERITLLLEGRDPTWARALAQGQVELRIGIPDERGRRRVLRIARQDTPFSQGLRGKPEGHAGPRDDTPRHAPDGNSGTATTGDAPGLQREPTWLWVLVGEDYQDERRLPLRSAPTPVACLQLGAGHWFLEVELPRERLQNLQAKPGRLELELASSAVRGDGRPAGLSPPSEPGGPGIDGGGQPGGGMGGRPGDGGPGGGGMGGGPGGNRPRGGGHGGGDAKPSVGPAADSPMVSGLPLKITVLLDE